MDFLVNWLLDLIYTYYAPVAVYMGDSIEPRGGFR